MLRNTFSIAVLWILSFGLMVIRLLPESHGMVDVRYVVADVTYQRTFAPHLQSSLISKGASVRVYYWPEDPNVAVIAPPAEILTEQLPSWLAGSLLISVGVVAAVLARRIDREVPGVSLRNNERA